MKAIKKDGYYRLYKTADGYELWIGRYGDTGARLGYVADPENWEYALDMAKEEIRYLAWEGE